MQREGFRIYLFGYYLGVVVELKRVVGGLQSPNYWGFSSAGGSKQNYLSLGSEHLIELHHVINKLVVFNELKFFYCIRDFKQVIFILFTSNIEFEIEDELKQKVEFLQVVSVQLILEQNMELIHH